MTDYWVSQGRKFCEFCKCSIADNKPSIQFHENGKKHKENVAKRLQELQKKATKDAKDAVKFDEEMKKIEAAALKAYANDVKASADYTSQLIQSGIKGLPSSNSSLPESTGKSVDTSSVAYEKYKELEGNMLGTGSKEGKKPNVQLPVKNNNNGKKNKKPIKANCGKSKGTLSLPLPEKKMPTPVEVFPSGNPYGTWQKVETKNEKPIDLQLPVQEFVQISVPKLRDDSERKFKEKVVATGIHSGSEEISFKKRKISAEAKKNMRRRLSDD